MRARRSESGSESSDVKRRTLGASAASHDEVQRKAPGAVARDGCLGVEFQDQLQYAHGLLRPRRGRSSTQHVRRQGARERERRRQAEAGAIFRCVRRAIVSERHWLREFDQQNAHLHVTCHVSRGMACAKEVERGVGVSARPMQNKSKASRRAQWREETPTYHIDVGCVLQAHDVDGQQAIAIGDFRGV